MTSFQTVVSLMGPHLREALRINRVLHMERLNARRSGRYMAILDAKGVMHYAERDFVELKEIARALGIARRRESCMCGS